MGRKDWDWTLAQIARRVKDTRDKDFILKNAKGQTVNRRDSIFWMGTSHASMRNAQSYIKQFAAPIIVHMDHQARV